MCAISQLICAVGIIVILAGFSVDACSLNKFPDLCAGVNCTNGQQCELDHSYYCNVSICRPVASCTKNMDPCADFPCPAGHSCVRVRDKCVRAGEVPGWGRNMLCTFKAQCNASVRPGSCPLYNSLWWCGRVRPCTDDSVCGKDEKCCPDMARGDSYCVTMNGMESAGEEDVEMFQLEDE